MISNSDTGESTDRIPVGVIGASGYTGLELLRILADYESVDVRFASSRSQAGEPSPIQGLVYDDPDAAPVEDVEAVFLCVPHGEAVSWVERLAGGPRIVDLTADHRPGSGREDGAVYGLAEINRDLVADARLVANPGCYPTGVLFALIPLVEAGAVDRRRLTVVNAASGVTGAGRTPRQDLLFA